VEIKIVERAAFTVVGLHYRGKNENNEIPLMWQVSGPRIQEIKDIVDRTVAYGVSADMDQSTGEFTYIAGFEVSSAENAPKGMVAFEVPGGRYAVFTTTLPQLGETFHNAFETWLRYTTKGSTSRIQGRRSTSVSLSKETAAPSQVHPSKSRQQPTQRSLPEGKTEKGIR
jgi:predicted transcriptional regulator YdeE